MFHKFVKISLNITVVKEQIKSVHSFTTLLRKQIALALR